MKPIDTQIMQTDKRIVMSVDPTLGHDRLRDILRVLPENAVTVLGFMLTHNTRIQIALNHGVTAQDIFKICQAPEGEITKGEFDKKVSLMMEAMEYMDSCLLITNLILGAVIKSCAEPDKDAGLEAAKRFMESIVGGEDPDSKEGQSEQ